MYICIKYNKKSIIDFIKHIYSSQCHNTLFIIKQKHKPKNKIYCQ